MATIRDIVEASRQMEAFKRELLQVPELHARIAETFASLGGVNHVLEDARRQMLAFEKNSAAMRAVADSLARPAFDVSRSIAEMLERSRPNFELAADSVSKATRDWQSVFQAVEAVRMPSFVAFETHFGKLYELSAVAERALAGVRLENFGMSLGVSNNVRQALVDAHSEFSERYRSLFDSIAANELAVLEVPQELTKLPAVEYFNQSALIVSTSGGETEPEVREAISEVQQEEAAANQDRLVTMLAELNADFPSMLLGARAAVEAKPPDYVRHFAASLRELFTHVMQTLAPDDQVKSWTKDPKDYHNGRPTRKTRLRFIIQDLPLNFGGFLSADVDAVLEFIDSFQKGTHAVRPSFTPDQVLELGTRMEGLLRFLLVIKNCR
jgi:Predicted pPIWI-associating nuclease